MDERSSGGDASAMRPITADELLPLWAAFRRGEVVPCPRDGGSMALAVDATAHAYRMICVKCGAASPWFESQPTGIHVRSGTSSMPAPSRRPAHED